MVARDPDVKDWLRGFFDLRFGIPKGTDRLTEQQYVDLNFRAYQNQIAINLDGMLWLAEIDWP